VGLVRGSQSLKRKISKCSKIGVKRMNLRVPEEGDGVAVGWVGALGEGVAGGGATFTNNMSDGIEHSTESTLGSNWCGI